MRKESHSSYELNPHFRVEEIPQHSRATEEYLKLIYELGEDLLLRGDIDSLKDNRITTTTMARALHVTPASVTNMVKRLSTVTPPLLNYEKHRGVQLTPEGERAALEVIRAHRLLEQFLYTIMGFRWDEVHTEALKLQHALSPAFVQRMTVLLNNPPYDPHGAPIPGPDLTMPQTPTCRLATLLPGQKAQIARVPDENPELLCYFQSEGILPGEWCEILTLSSHDHSLGCRFGNQTKTLHLGSALTQIIEVFLTDPSD